jgi:hypothetical protein
VNAGRKREDRMGIAIVKGDGGKREKNLLLTNLLGKYKKVFQI